MIETPASGLYIHIPFCRKACTYCDFHFVTSLRNKGDMVSAICGELALWDAAWPRPQAQTLYFGGGTPSLLTDDELARIMEAAGFAASMRPHGAEITLEANPDDLAPAKLRALRAAGINRLSIGVQSFSEPVLAWMNRSHGAGQARACIRDAQEAGFDNFSIDLIFGIPDTVSDMGWAAQLREAVALRPAHLSLYALTVEERTPLAHHIRHGRATIGSEQQYRDAFLLAHRTLTDAGYEHYELSNYALPGHRARHNAAYWNGTPYLGAGPSAHSYNGDKRWWNAPNNAKYLRELAESRLPTAGEETLSQEMKYHEYLMTGLRTANGIDTAHIRTAFGVDIWAQHGSYLERLVAAGEAVVAGTALRLTPEGWLMSDAITGELF